MAEAVEAVAGAGEMPDTAPLFVYGTLRPCLLHRVIDSTAQAVIRESTVLGEATIPGQLFDLGSYPGYTPPADHTTDTASLPHVVGDLLEVTQADLAVLDDYEECGGPQPLYRRERRTARRRDDAAAVDCWIYVYNRPFRGRALIPSGDYALHLSQHDD